MWQNFAVFKGILAGFFTNKMCKDSQCKRGLLPAHSFDHTIDDIEPKRYESLHDAARDTGILRPALMNTHKNGEVCHCEMQGRRSEGDLCGVVVGQHLSQLEGC